MNGILNPFYTYFYLILRESTILSLLYKLGKKATTGKR